MTTGARSHKPTFGARSLIVERVAGLIQYFMGHLASVRLQWERRAWEKGTDAH